MRFGKGGGRDTDDLAAGFLHRDDLLDAPRYISRLGGNHALDNDRMAAAHDNLSDMHGPRFSARISEFHQYCLRSHYT
jgi:hypothetical protein